MKKINQLIRIGLLSILFVLSSIHASSNEVRIVKDSFGNEIEIPLHIEKVAPLIPAFAQMTGMLGHGEKVVATRVVFSDMFYKVFPEIKKVNPSNIITANVETIVSSGAQVVYGPTTITLSDIQKEQLKKSNIVVVDVSNFGTIEGMKECITIIGNILGENAPTKAKEFIEYYNWNIEKINNKTKDLTNKPKVLLLSFNAGNYRVSNGRDISSVYSSIAGGKNVAENLETGGSAFILQVSNEQILSYNPDIIIVSSLEAKERVLKEKAFQGVNAVKTNKVYITPRGAFLWSARSAEGALQPLWLATKFHPELFSDINMREELKYFYKNFYHYNLNEKEIDEILSGLME